MCSQILLINAISQMLLFYLDVRKKRFACRNKRLYATLSVWHYKKRSRNSLKRALQKLTICGEFESYSVFHSLYFIYICNIYLILNVIYLSYIFYISYVSLYTT